MRGRSVKEGQATPDGRYLVIRGRLWRKSDPALSEAERHAAVHALMDARRDVGAALRSADSSKLRDARDRVEAAKRRLGERGPVWWTDGSPDYGRRLVVNSPYADWWPTLEVE